MPEKQLSEYEHDLIQRFLADCDAFLTKVASCQQIPIDEVELIRKEIQRGVYKIASGEVEADEYLVKSAIFHLPPILGWIASLIAGGVGFAIVDELARRLRIPETVADTLVPSSRGGSTFRDAPRWSAREALPGESQNLQPMYGLSEAELEAIYNWIMSQRAGEGGVAYAQPPVQPEYQSSSFAKFMQSIFGYPIKAELAPTARGETASSMQPGRAGLDSSGTMLASTAPRSSTGNLKSTVNSGGSMQTA